MKNIIKQIEEAAVRLDEIVKHTPLEYCSRLSDHFGAKIYFKREDQQIVRSFKIRGAYNKIVSLTDKEKKRGVVCASAGNHAQGVAFSCYRLKIKGTIFMPIVTPNQKIDKVKKFGGTYTDIQLAGHTFDEANNVAQKFCYEKDAVYIHPFNDPYTIAGQGTIGKEIYEDLKGKVDYVLSCIGGGGLIAGVATYLKNKNKNIKIIAVEPTGAASMYTSIQNKKVTPLSTLDTFVDGAAVKTVGNMTFNICQKKVDKFYKEPEGKICKIMVELYQNEGIITEPDGATSVAGLSNIKEDIKGKTVVCIISGGNNDILRYPEIMERSLVYQEKKHYFIVEFAQKPGQLKNFLNNALGATDDIVLFEYIKKNSKEKGPALVGIEMKDRKDYEPLLSRMKEIGLNYKVIKSDDMLFNYLI